MPAKRASSQRVIPKDRGDQRDAVSSGFGELLFSRAAALIAGWVLFIGVVVYHAQTYSIAVFSEFLTDGLAAFAWVGAAGLAGDVLLGRKLRGPLRLPTAAALGLGVFSLIALGLGLAGWLNYWTAVSLPLVSISAWAIHWAFAGRRALPALTGDWRRVRDWLLAPAGSGWLWVAVVPILAIAATGASIMPGFLWKPLDPHPYDVLSYHLEIPREWYEAGRIFPLHHNAFCFFPMNQEMHYLMAMHLRGGPWAAMYMAQFINLLIMLLAMIGVRALVITALTAGENPAQPAHAKTAGNIAGVLAASVPWIPMLAAVAYVESSFLLYGVLAAAWAVRALLSSEHSIRRLALAGALAGLAGGAKYTAAPMVMAAIPAALLLASLGSRFARDKRSLLIGLGVFLLAAGLIFSPWLIRNFLWSGNPIFPLAMRMLGQDHFTQQQVERFVLAHNPPLAEQAIGARVMAFAKQVLADWQFGYVLMPLALFAMGASFFFRRPALRFLAIMLLIQMFIWGAFTHLLARFFMPVIPFAAGAVGVSLLSFSAARAAKAWLIGGGAVALIASIIGFVNLNKCFADYHEYLPAVGLTDPWQVLAQPLTVLSSPGAKAAMIGDAQAFFYPIPSSRIDYRDIFNVNIPPGQNSVDGWLGASVAELRKDHFVIINLSELNRLSQTYYGIPPIPSEWQRPNPYAPIILPPYGFQSTRAPAQ